MLGSLTILCVLVAVSNAHVCLISPPQRGSMLGLNTAGADDCFLTTAPCVSLGSEGGELHELVRVPDGGEKALHLYSMNVTLPREVQGGPLHFIQVVYHPNNPAAPANFYQCGDIMIARRPPGQI
ncbi:hypothetical protein KUTeg_019899 [Tegillarca granosa]|uniref:Uncharacterized protein n=1 Tax=Tegillarca granosa TaxID=220873 RepID=A0ABQ9EDX4_TEGGR|nr:hypothetical protein KUTeg_019899 [Tegillarca granosa]